jgi:hypothetical protein
MFNENPVGVLYENKIKNVPFSPKSEHVWDKFCPPNQGYNLSGKNHK